MAKSTNAPLNPNGYVSKVLLGNETILHQTRLHRIVYAKSVFSAVLLLLVSILTFLISDDARIVLSVWTASILIVVPMWLAPYIRSAHSEYAVTDTRVILKTGLLRQTVLDLQWKGVGGISVGQTLFGRLFNYGTMGVLGDSAGQKFPRVADPFAFKRAAEEMIQKNANGNASK